MPALHGLTAFILIAPVLAVPAVLRSGLSSELRGGFNGISRGFRSSGNRLNNAHDSTGTGVVSRFVSRTVGQTAGFSTRSGQGFSRVLSRLISGLLVSSALVPMTIAVRGTAPAFLAALALLPRRPAGRLTGMTSTVRAGAPADAHGTPGVGQGLFCFCRRCRFLLISVRLRMSRHTGCAQRSERCPRFPHGPPSDTHLALPPFCHLTLGASQQLHHRRKQRTRRLWRALYSYPLRESNSRCQIESLVS